MYVAGRVEAGAPRDEPPPRPHPRGGGERGALHLEPPPPVHHVPPPARRRLRQPRRLTRGRGDRRQGAP
eukprot:1737769-Pyramimonas_sp.AAC.1